MKINEKFYNYIENQKDTAVLCGGRRSGKTYSILQWLLIRCLENKKICSIAVMTHEQGRRGVFSDLQNIIENENLNGYIFQTKNPMEFSFKNGSKIFIKSYENSEKAKGIACDYLYINEANLFSKQHYIDLSVNVREKTLIDFNPNIDFWGLQDFDNICFSNWKENPFLTEKQINEFEKMRERAECIGASPADVFFYRVYYLGELAEISGDIFNAANIRMCEEFTSGLIDYTLFIDPSALRGSDYTAISLTARNDENVYLIESFLSNNCSRQDVVSWIIEICKKFDVKNIFCETNGIIGIDFFQYLSNKNIPIQFWNSHKNKFERIMQNYYFITQNFYYFENENNKRYMEQVFTFNSKCKHDDAVDALNSSIIYHRNELNN